MSLADADAEGIESWGADLTMPATAARERVSGVGDSGFDVWDDAIRGERSAGIGYPMFVLQERSEYWRSKRTKNVSDFFIRYRSGSKLDLPSARARRNAERILSLLRSLDVELTPSDNSTYYLEWETAEGFASLEIGTDQFGFSFLPNVGSAYGENGALRDTAKLRHILEAHI